MGYKRGMGERAIRVERGRIVNPAIKLDRERLTRLVVARWERLGRPSDGITASAYRMCLNVSAFKTRQLTPKRTSGTSRTCSRCFHAGGRHRRVKATLGACRDCDCQQFAS